MIYTNKIILFFVGAFIIISIAIGVFIRSSKNNEAVEAEVTDEETSDTATEIESEEAEKESEETISEETEETTAEATEWKYDEDGNPYLDHVTDEMWEELRAQTGMSEEEFYASLEEIKNSAHEPYWWDDSEAPLTDEQIAEIDAKRAAELAEYEAKLAEEATIEATTETVTKAVTEKAAEKHSDSEIETTSYANNTVY